MNTSDKFAVYVVASVIVGFTSLLLGALVLLLEINAMEAMKQAEEKTDAELILASIHSSKSYENTERYPEEERGRQRSLAYHNHY